MSNYSDRVLITLDHTNCSRQILVDYLLKHGAIGIISCIEYHGGTIEKMNHRIQNPVDKLTEITSRHMCATAFGNFQKKNLTNRGRKWARKQFNKEDQHWSTMYCHTNTSKKGKTTYSLFPFPKMVEYLTEGTDKKDVDTSPLILLKDDKDPKGYKESTIENLLEAYDDYSNTWDYVENLKRAKTSHAHVLRSIYERTNDTSLTNIFMSYYDNIDISPKIQYLPSNIQLRTWQQKVVSWAMEPRQDDGPNGMWLNLAAGQGKTVIFQALMDMMGGLDNIFIMPTRVGGKYTQESMMSYANQPLIIIEELMYHIDDFGIQRPTRELQELLKRITERFPMTFEFGGRYRSIVPHARILIASNQPRIHSPDSSGKCPISRRYINVTPSDIVSLETTVIPEISEVKFLDL